MEWFGLLVASGGLVFAARWWRIRQVDQRAWDEELEGVRRLAEDDVTALGQLLQRIDANAVDGLDDGTRKLHRTAVESLDFARHAISRVTDADQLTAVTAAVATGRNGLAAVQAKLAGRPAPEQRAMCFFDPRHGPSVTDALWARPGFGERRVPACSTDARRVADHLEPQVRRVTIGARTAPYWSAGRAFRPYTQGYFADVATLAWAFNPETADAAADASRPGHVGSGIVGSSGHFDGGGFDGSGAPPD